MNLLFMLSEFEDKVSLITNNLSIHNVITKDCKCQHCLEIKNQLNRAEKRQCKIHSEKSYNKN